MIQENKKQSEISTASSIDTQTKAVIINRDKRVYGTFAEIGAGQEIAGWFFRVGGASGTVAKTMSAYDMKVSDDIYGKASRYVSENRLISMLDHEYALINERLSHNFGSEKTFFALADTVSARNFKGTNECHGWLGIRFQRNPGDNPSDIILHVSMHDNDNFLQQQAIGILGVNLLYASYFLKDDGIEAFLSSLLDDIKPGRLEVDVAYFRGEYFPDWNDELVGIHLIEDGLSDAVLYSPKGHLVQPSSIIRKRPVLVERGIYRVLHDLQQDYFDKATEYFKQGLDKDSRDPLIINEVSIRSVHHKQTMETAEVSTLLPQLLSNGSYVMLSDFAWYYRVSQYIRRHTNERISFVMGISTLIKLFSDDVYDTESGNILEALGKLLAIGVQVIAYPMSKDNIQSHLACTKDDLSDWNLPESDVITADNIEPMGNEKYIYKYMIDSGGLITL